VEVDAHMQERRRATIADVAAAAGVSTSTVSRALSGHGYVARSVAARVIAAAEEIGYVPDANARNLRVGSRRDVGVLISDLANPFYAELASGIEGRLREAGYHMLLVNNGGDQAEELAAVNTFAALRVPGVIVTPVSEHVVGKLVRHGIHVVQADRVVDASGADAVVGANDVGGRMATELLIRRGHSKIALIIDEAEWTTGAGRLAGYRTAHHEAGLTVDEDLVAFAGFDVDRARSVIGALLDRRHDITALLAANNLLAQAAYTELADRRISIPGRVSLVAYDDVPWMSMVRPRVTTVAQHADEIGRRSADLLISRLQDANRRTAVSVLVNPSLVHRESVGAPFGGSRRRRRSVAPATPAPATPSAGLSAPDAAPGPVAASTASRGTAGSTADAAAPAGA
jgi:LacI family transcriptional regulator